MNNRCFIIAEAGVNHNGRIELAERLVDAAKAAGADAVKFQTFRADSLVSTGAPLAEYQRGRSGGASQLEMIRALELSEADHRTLLKRCRRAGIEFMSTPFDEASADMLARLGVKRLKIPSGEITNKGLIRHVARKGLPVILSTGMSTLAEVRKAVGWIRETRRVPLTVLHCVTEYPAPAAQVNLRAMDSLRAATGLPVGYSDHTLGVEVAVASAARGATVLEKHLTLDRSLPGPDHAASLEPREFARMVAAIRLVESALGDGVKRPAPCERKNISVARRGLVAARDLPRGRRLAKGDVAAKRPAKGLPPELLDRVVGRTLRRALRRDQPLTRACL